MQFTIHVSNEDCIGTYMYQLCVISQLTVRWWGVVDGVAWWQLERLRNLRSIPLIIASLQGAGVSLGSTDGSLPVEAFISISDLGYDQLTTALTLTLKFNDDSVSTICYTGLQLGYSGKQCPSDCTQCTTTYSRTILQPYPIGFMKSGPCGTCSWSRSHIFVIKFWRTRKKRDFSR